MEPLTFHDGRVELYAEDCLAVLKVLPDCFVDAVITDPPYHLTSIVKRFGGENAAPAKGNEAFVRASRGFMGKTWDGGDIAFRPDVWRECLRVLKPGGHLASFSGTRTYHRMACAIEDAGFEIRDQLAWTYGSGFPKSHDVSKGIARAYECRFKNNVRLAEHLSGHSLVELREERTGSVLGNVAIPPEGENVKLIVTGPVDGLSDPTATFLLESTDATCLSIDILWNAISADPCDPTKRFITTTKLSTITDSPILNLLPSLSTLANIGGAGTALKPAWEPICLARKPLSESTVAANVLRWGTGAINVDACRVAGAVPNTTRGNSFGRMNDDGWQESQTVFEPNSLGRFPANLVHDGSPEVLAGFPDVGGSGVARELKRNAKPARDDGYGMDKNPNPPSGMPYADSGSAARFFYCAKANKKDRAGSNHPTVKPISLMAWLVRMLTPPGGLVLDPFAGTGTLAAATFQENRRAILIEREELYRSDIVRRVEALAA